MSSPSTTYRESPPQDATLQRLGPAEQVLCRAILGLRWVGLALAATVTLYQRDELQRPATAVITLSVMLALTIAATAAFMRAPRLLLHPTAITVEVLAAFGAQVASGWAFGPDRPLGTSLALLWALAPVMTAGVGFGPTVGLGAGMLVAAGAWVGDLAPDLRSSLQLVLDDGTEPRFLPAVTTLVLTGLAGYGAGFITRLLHQSHDEIAELRARQQVASTLHDGALQALAYISRRAADPDIARVARDADTELRGYLNATLTTDTGDLRQAIITAARRIERQLDGQLRLAIDEELTDRPADVVAAVTGAITEALTNAAKHAAADHVTVYAAATENGIDLSVIDDGVGFDQNRVPAGGGLDQSIRARLRRVGGTVTINSAEGAGTEVELWVP